MKITRELMEKISSTVEALNLLDTYEYVGIRVQDDDKFALGKIAHRSHIWDNGEDTGIELDGICVTDINAIGHELYFGDHLAIICGYCAEFGADIGELIVRDAEVVAILA